MAIAWTIDIGQVVILAVMGMASVGAYYALREVVKTLGVRMDKVEGELSRQTSILVGISVQEVEIRELKRRVAVLEHV